MYTYSRPTASPASVFARNHIVRRIAAQVAPGSPPGAARDFRAVYNAWRGFTEVLSELVPDSRKGALCVPWMYELTVGQRKAKPYTCRQLICPWCYCSAVVRWQQMRRYWVESFDRYQLAVYCFRDLPVEISRGGSVQHTFRDGLLLGQRLAGDVVRTMGGQGWWSLLPGCNSSGSIVQCRAVSILPCGWDFDSAAALRDGWEVHTVAARDTASCTEWLIKSTPDFSGIFANPMAAASFLRVRDGLRLRETYGTKKRKKISGDFQSSVNGDNDEY